MYQTVSAHWDSSSSHQKSLSRLITLQFMHTFSCLFLRSLGVGLIGPKLAFASCWHGHQWLWISFLCMLVQLLQHICHTLVRLWRQVHWLLQLGLPPHSCTSCPKQAQCQISTRLSYLSTYDNTSKHHRTKPTWAADQFSLLSFLTWLISFKKAHSHTNTTTSPSRSPNLILVKYRVEEKYNHKSITPSPWPRIMTKPFKTKGQVEIQQSISICQRLCAKTDKYDDKYKYKVETDYTKLLFSAETNVDLQAIASLSNCVLMLFSS